MTKFLSRMLAEVNKDRDKSTKDDDELNQIAGLRDSTSPAADGQWILDLGLNNPKALEILRLLKGDELLIEATLKFVRTKQQEVAQASAKATLVALYGQEEFDRMIEEAQKQELVG